MDILIANSDAYLGWLYKKSNNVILGYLCHLLRLHELLFRGRRFDDEIVDEVTGEIL